MLGDTCPARLTPVEVERGAAEADLVVIAPTAEQRRDRVWVRQTSETVATRLSPSGIAYVLPSSGRQLRRSLETAGLAASGKLLHVPDPEQTRYVAPIGTPAERYLLSGRIPMKGLKRRAALAAGAGGRGLFGPSGTLHRRAAEEPLARWLFELDGSRPAGGSCLLVLTGREPQGALLYRFHEGASTPDAVAKVSARAGEEVRGLREIAPGAARAGARVPELLFAGALPGTPLVLQSMVAGRNADRLVEDGTLAVEDFQALLADWLESWSRSSARVRPLGDAELERFVFSPVARIPALSTGHNTYLDHLRALCAEARGRPCPLVAVHGDLTAANVLLDEQANLGVVDWEASSEDSLPLTDFLYTAVDAVAARTAYADRPSAFASCFAAGGDAAPFVERLRVRLAEALALDDILAELCFHACWLHHAANESERSSNGPFVRILEAVAADPRLARRGGRGTRQQ